MRLFMLLLLVVTGCAVQTGPCLPEKLAELPTVPVLRVPYVRVLINARPALMLIDTGANSSVLTTAAAARLGVAPTGKRAVSQSVAGFRLSDRGRVDELRLASLVVPGADVLITDTLQPLGLTGDGILGLDVLAAYQVELDSPRRRIAFYSGPACRTEPPAGAGSFHGVDVRRLPLGFLAVPLEANDKSFTALLDTGTSATVLSTRAAAALGVAVADPVRLPAGMRPRAGVLTRTAVLRDLRIAGSQAAFPVVDVADLPEGVDAIVGNDYMARRRLWLVFDPPRVFVADQPRPR